MKFIEQLKHMRKIGYLNEKGLTNLSILLTKENIDLNIRMVDLENLIQRLKSKEDKG